MPRHSELSFDSSPPGPPKGRGVERRICGINACRALFERRREDIVRAWFTEDVARRYFGAAMRHLSEQRRGYQVVEAEELERLTESTHHEGVCFQVVAPSPLSLDAYLARSAKLRRGVVLALEGVGNPHNLGAIVRVAAHFGVHAVLLTDAQALQSPAAMRTAEGGAEHVLLVEAGPFQQLLPRLRQAGFRLLTTSSHKGSSLYLTPLPEKCVILLGEEARGLSREVFSAGEVCVQIPGTGAVESLNVSVATGILLGEYWRQHSMNKEA